MPPYRRVKKRWMVGRSNEQRVAVVVIDHLQHGSNDSAEFPVVRAVRALSPEHVELVEHKNPRSRLQEGKDLFQVPCCLAQVRGHDRRKLHPHDGETQFPSERLCCYRLSASWGANEEQARPWLDPVRTQGGT